MRKAITRMILTGILITAILLVGCSRTVPIPRLINGSGKVVTKELNFAGFTYVEVGSVFEVELVESGSYLTAITADDNLFDYIEVSQDGEILRIRLTPTYNYSGVTLKAKITLPKLSGLHLYGATNGTVKGFQSSNDFKLQLSGASYLDIHLGTGDTKLEISGATRVTGSLEAHDIEFRVSEAGKVELEGSANKMTLNASGASKLKLADFPVDQANVTLSGASEVNINVSGRLDIILTGASKLRYKGDPMIGNIMISDTSTIERK